MNKVRSFLLILLLAFTFLGNVGFSIFTHSCSEDGIFTSYFVKVDHRCENKEVSSSLPPCCRKAHADNGEQKIKKDNCCSESVDVFRIKLDHFSSSKIRAFYSSLADQVILNNYEPVFSYITEHVAADDEVYEDPPPKSFGKQLLIKHQVFRI